MTFAARAAAPLLAFALVAACDDGVGPSGQNSDFEVHVYVEQDDSVGFGAGDLPLEAAVSVTSNLDGTLLVAETGPDGIATFGDLEPGSYTVTHALTGATTGIELDGAAAQTVVAPFVGGTVVTRFIYDYQPGTLSGVLFRDENGTTFYEAGQDSVFRDVVVVLFAGTDTLGTALTTDVSDDDGMFDFGERPAGEYRIVVREPAGTFVLGANPREVSVAPAEATFHAIELAGDPTGAVITIDAARGSAVGDTVKVRGVVTAGQGTIRDDSFYMQDATGGIFVFGVSPTRGLAVGDSVQVIGVRSDSREETQLTALAVAELGIGEVPVAHDIDVAQLNAGTFQGELAQLVATVDSIQTIDNGFAVWVHDGTGDGIVFVDNDTDIDQAEFTLTSEQTITGVLGTYDRDDDGTIDLGDYRLQPRAAEDVD
jgi:hypothetical protein